MIVTESAKERIRWIKETHDKDVRLFIDSGGCAGFHWHFDLGEANDDDIVVDDIRIDPTSMTFLADAKVDFVEGFSGHHFQVDIPRRKSNCGCGKSFTM